MVVAEDIEYTYRCMGDGRISGIECQSRGWRGHILHNPDGPLYRCPRGYYGLYGVHSGQGVMDCYEDDGSGVPMKVKLTTEMLCPNEPSREHFRPQSFGDWLLYVLNDAYMCYTLP
jgi:hypothetical protein